MSYRSSSMNVGPEGRSGVRRALAAFAALVLGVSTFAPDATAAGEAVLRVTKTGQVTSHNYKGAVIQWTINYSCISLTGACDSTTLVDTVPGALTVTDPGGASAVGNALTWNIGTVAGGDSTSRTFTSVAPCSTTARTFTNAVTGSSSNGGTVNATAPLNVAGADCTVPAPPPFGKAGPNPINKGARLNYTVTLPAKAGEYTVEDTLPVGTTFLGASGAAFNNTQIFCAPSWVAVGGCSNPTKVRWTVPAANSPLWLNGSNGDVNWSQGFINLRVPETFAGTSIVNNAAVTVSASGDPAVGTTVTAGPANVVAGGPMARVAKSVAKLPGQRATSGFTPAGSSTSIDDVAYSIVSANDGNYNNAGAPWTAPIVTDLLPPETSWTPENWYSITSAPAGCSSPVFTATPNFGGSGRTQLKWEFGGGCLLRHDLDTNEAISINLTARMKPGVAFDTNISNDMTAGIGGGLALVTCDSGFVSGALCPANASFPMPKLATLESSKWVNGVADPAGQFGRFPSVGETSVDAQGFATYRIFLRATGNVDSSMIEIADVLPFVGDTAVSETALTRLSEWREVLAGPVTVEFLDRTAVTAGTGVNDLTGFTPLVAGTDYDIAYSSSTNPCRLDGAGQIKFDATAGPTGCADEWGSGDVRAAAFKLKVTKTLKRFAAGPDSGDVIRLTVKVKDFGPAAPDIDKVAWNSFAYTTTGAGLEFLTAEPIKVGVKMTAKPSSYASLGDYVWYDENNNGTQDTQEDGIDNVLVHLYNAAGEVVQTTITGPDPVDSSKHGWYRFDGLDPATTYTVKLDRAADYAVGGPLNGFVLSPQDVAAATDAKDSDAALVSGFPTIASAPTGAAGTHMPTYDIGFWKEPQYSLGNRVWADDDNSGSITGTETGIDNVLVNVFKKNTDGSFTKLTTDTTKNGGYYRFDGLVAGDYYVQLDSSNWADGGVLQGRRSTSGAAKQSDPNTDIESDDNGLTPATLADYAAAGSTKGIVSNLVALGPWKSEPTNETDVPQGEGAVPARGNMSLDFGVITPKFAVGNYVWLDANNNGLQDSTEVGINGVTVNVYTKGGTLAGTATTANGPDGKPGFYLVDNLIAGEYYAEFTSFPADHVLSVQTAGTDVTKDSDPNVTTGRTANFVLDESLPAVVATTDGSSLVAKNVLRTIDAGIHPMFSLGNQVWHDVNGDSLVSVGEVGIDGVTVELYNVDSLGKPVGAPIASQLTNTGGYYLFTGLVAGDYAVVIPKSNFDTGKPLHTFYSSGTTSTGEAAPALASSGSDNDDNGVLITDNADAFKGAVLSSKVTLGPTASAPSGEPATPGHPDTTTDGRSNLTVDFGFLTMSIGNLVFTDTDNNGVLDGSDAGISGVVVHLYRDDNGDGVAESGNPVADTTTNGDGQYLFTGIAPGKYVVEIEPPAGYYSSSGESGSYTGPFEPGKGDDTSSDSNDHGTTAGNRIRSTSITLSPGTEPTSTTETSGNAIATAAVDSNTDLTVDFGLVPGASIGNYVWLDNNRNGIQDDAVDAGIDGVTVKLIDKNGNVAKTTQTGPGPDGKPGFYRFDVIPGDYKVVFDLTTLPEGFLVSPKDAGGDDTKDSDASPTDGMTSVTALTAGENDPTWDLGIYPTAVAVGNFVWVDTNGNGLQDDGPTSGIAGVKATLFDSAGREVTKDIQGSPIAPVLTDAAGQYLFSNLKPGTYTVKFTLPEGYAPTRSTTGDDRGTDSNGLTATSKALKGGQSDLTLDLGIVKPVSIGNYVWIDADRDGVQNDGPNAGLKGVVVAVFDAVTGRPVTADAYGRPVAPKETDADGKYVFADLLPGRYTVTFTLPGGYLVTKTAIGDPATDSNGLEATSANLASGEQDMTLDLGVYFPVTPLIVPPASTPTTPSSPAPSSTVPPSTPTSVPTIAGTGPSPVTGGLSGVVYLDGDRSSTKGTNELGRPGVKVNLLDKNGVVLQSTVSDEAGRFQFNADPGDYIVEIIPPAELGTTSPIRVNVSVLSSGIESPVLSFGLATEAAELALTGTSPIALLRLAALMVLVGLGLTNVTRRRRRRIG